MSADSATSYHGLYINLDRSTARRAAIDEQLTALGLKDRYGRFAAVDGSALPPSRGGLSPGELGAFFSHMRALESARSSGGAAVHIMEDDALLSEHVRPVIEDAIAADLFQRFDILFTDVLAPPHLGMLKGLKSVFDRIDASAGRPLRLFDLQIIDLAGQNFSCLTSYVVGAKSIDRVLALYTAEAQSGPSKPVDLFVRDGVLSGKLRAAFLFPFITSLRLEEIAGSTIGGSALAANPSVMVLAVLRYLFFVNRDVAKAKAFLDAATKENRRPTNPHHDMIVQALEFVVSADFQEF
ncbi:MAG TPA: glycosyltransferase family 25 protein [Micropepsaceae bacterium]|nr:glycosyltransferase family 25 protein [Micropepsaceae bacterium]